MVQFDSLNKLNLKEATDMDIEAIQAIVTRNDDSTLPASTPVNGLSNPYIHLATSESTRKAYRSDIHHFEGWGGKLPATPEMIASYLHAYADALKPTTLARHLIALKHWHTYQGFTDPTSHPAIQKTLAGITRAHGRPKDKARALTPDELALIVTSLKKSDTLAAIRDSALLQIGFFGALRRSELVAIRYEDIKWDKAGIEVLLPSSKTDQTHEGQYCAIPYGNDTLCPIRALENWLAESKIKSGSIFRRIIVGEHIGSSALTPLSINNILKNRALEAGITDITKLSSHSLRRGLATSAARAGAPLQAIMRAGRWKQTNTVMEYIEASERFTENAASSVLHAYIKKA